MYMAMQNWKSFLMPYEQAVEELNKAQELLNPIMDKYDYKKLPKRN